MKISIDYSVNDPQNIKVISAKYIADFAIKICFTDGTEKQIDFEPFLSKSHHPAIRKYLDAKEFSKFEIVDGNLNWNDYDLIFPVWDLYMGKI